VSVSLKNFFPGSESRFGGLPVKGIWRLVKANAENVDGNRLYYDLK